jgi:hypothetical protein
LYEEAVNPESAKDFVRYHHGSPQIEEPSDENSRLV